MPIYEYQCDTCGVFEVEQKMSDNALTQCPTCKEKGKKSKVERIISASAFHLKGGGWYKSDYASSNNSKTSGSTPKSTSTDSTSTTSTEKKETSSALKTAPCGTGCGCAKE